MDETKVCRICFKRIAEGVQWFNLSGALTVKLLYFLPTFDLSYATTPILCTQCVVGIELAYQFMNICIKSESIIGKLREKHITFDQLQQYILREKNANTVSSDEDVDITENHLNAVDDRLVKFNKNFPHCVKETKLKRIYRCYTCNYTTDTKKYLVNHMREHKKKRETYNCLHCHYHFNTKLALEKHILKHTRERKREKHKCSECSYTSTTKWHMIRHSKTHSSNSHMILMCHKCEFKTVRKFVLMRHLLQCNDNT
ncbi:hypothetical protein FQA39_LY14911 [Lamprigera yunnana]|nr:hypothetical protein FQA39_LY14911 [Lamprigera yunnana]